LTARQTRSRGRFHGRVERPEHERCAEPGCDAPGEFRAPLSNRGRRGWKYLCLDHVRAFNAGYNYFDGLDPDAFAAESANPAWDRSTRAFAGNAYAGAFRDPLGAMRGRFGPDVFAGPAGQGDNRIGAEERAALEVLDLDENASWADIRRRYKALIRALHPDANGGDRSKEGTLRRVIDAYTQLRGSPAFGQKN
jgi:hypothetical protein